MHSFTPCMLYRVQILRQLQLFLQMHYQQCKSIVLVHKPETTNDLKHCTLYKQEAKEMDLQCYRHRLDVFRSKWSPLINHLYPQHSSSLPVDLLLQHGGTGSVWGDNAVLQRVTLHHAQINETELASPHTHKGVHRRYHQPLHS